MRLGWVLEWTRRGRQAAYILGLFLIVDGPVRSKIALNCCSKIHEIPPLHTLAVVGTDLLCARRPATLCSANSVLNFDLCPRFLNTIFLQGNYKSFQSYHAFYWTLSILGQDL